MDRRLIAAFVIMAMVVVTVPMVCDSESDAAAGDITESSTIVASGTCGTSGARWEYSRTDSSSELSVSGGRVTSLGSTSSSDKWVLSALTIDGTAVESAQLSSYKISDILDSRVALTVSADVTAASGAMKALGVTSVKFTGSSVKVADGLFSGCTLLRTVDLTNVSSVGKNSFQGTPLTSVDLKKATIDVTSFKGCASLKTFTATNSTVYKVNNSLDGVSLLMSYDLKTVFMCAPGVSDKVINVSALNGVTKVNLCYADVAYVIDEVGGKSSVSFVKQTDSTEVGMRYSSLGMKTITPTYVNGTLKFSITLNDGWTIDGDLCKVEGGTYTLASDSASFTVKVSSASCYVYPMGVNRLTYEDLKDLDAVGDWKAVASNIPQKTGLIGDIDPLEITVTGYTGTTGEGIIKDGMSFHGIQCTVTAIKAAAGAMNGLKDLTIVGDVAIGSAAFANCATLEAVVADDVSAVDDGAFRYCTNLKTASFPACASFGSGVFEYCLELKVLGLGASSITFGDGAFSGCISLGLLTVGLDSTVSGASGVPVLHYDTSETDVSFQVIGDQILVYWDFSQYLTYSSTRDGEGETVMFYYGYKTVIPLLDEMYITVKPGSSVAGAKCLVVFDKGLGMDADSVAVTFGGTVAKPGDPFKLGYTFVRWTLDKEEYDFSTPVKETIVLTAEWAKENEIDMTPMYLMAIFGASIAATAVVLAIARKQ